MTASNGRIDYELFVLPLLMALIALMMLMITNRTLVHVYSSSRWMLAVATSVALASLRPWSILGIYPLLSAYLLSIAGAVGSVYFLSGTRRIISIIAAALCATIATFSFGNGFLVWFVTIPLLIYDKNWHSRIRHLTLWISCSAAVLVLYFYNFQFQSQHPLPPLELSSLFAIVHYLFSAFGLMFFSDMKSALVGGGALIVITFGLSTYAMRHAYPKNLYPFLALLAYILLSALLVSIFRTELALPQRRYLLFFSMLPPILLHIFVLVFPHLHKIHIISISVFVVIIMNLNIHSLPQIIGARNWADQELACLQTYEIASTKCLFRMYPSSISNPTGDYVRAQAAVLEELGYLQTFRLPSTVHIADSNQDRGAYTIIPSDDQTLLLEGIIKFASRTPSHIVVTSSAQQTMISYTRTYSAPPHRSYAHWSTEVDLKLHPMVVTKDIQVWQYDPNKQVLYPLNQS